MSIIQRLKTDRKFLLIAIGLILGVFLLPYLTIPALIIWWFYKKSSFSKKAKVITSAVIGSLFTILITASVIAYSNDVEPKLTISEPLTNATVQSQQVRIKGTYEPPNGKVWIDGKEITASNGSFEYNYTLKDGENKIDVSTGNWKRTHAYLAVISKRPEKKPTPTEEPKATPASSNPAKAITASSTPEAQTKSDKVLVIKVIDGDTIQVEGGKVVRYIGIDTPETVDPRQGVQCFGKEASDKNKGLVAGKKVRLVKDVSETDRYGRLLRYVYVGDVFVNDYLVRQGYAYTSSYPPDVKYQKQFNEAQAEARTNNRGLWSSCSSSTTAPTSQPATQVKQTNTNNSSPDSYTCSGKTRCGQMTSCSEAYFYLNSCGVKSLDGDKDGVPCETICN